MNRRTLLKMSAAAFVVPGLPAFGQDDRKALIDAAYVYLYPMVKNYLTLYQYAVDKGGAQYKAPFNEISNVARVYTPEDTAIITPNSDTPYSFVVMDLRAEPIVITMPKVEANRYYSTQIVDLYTHNVDYLGTRVDGNDGGDFLITGPGWAGEVPEGITRVVELPTSIGLALMRTQLFDAADIGRVKEVQAGYRVRTLSTYAGTPAPAAAPAIDWPPIDDGKVVTDFWPLAAFLLRFAPPLPWETDLRAGFAASLGLTGDGAAWPPASLAPETAEAMRDMSAPGEAAIRAAAQKIVDSTRIFGTPEVMKGNYMDRASAALGGIYGNSVAEALYVMYVVGPDGTPLDGAKNRYAIRFPADALPPVDAFWSITMYGQPDQLLVANPIDRYLINSAMLGGLTKTDAGEIVLYLQHESPGAELESNWLPAPDRGFYAILRLYLPKPAALDGTWKRPAIELAS